MAFLHLEVIADDDAHPQSSLETKAAVSAEADEEMDLDS